MSLLKDVLTPIMDLSDDQVKSTMATTVSLGMLKPFGIETMDDLLAKRAEIKIEGALAEATETFAGIFTKRWDIEPIAEEKDQDGNTIVDGRQGVPTKFWDAIANALVELDGLNIKPHLAPKLGATLQFRWEADGPHPGWDVMVASVGKLGKTAKGKTNGNGKGNGKGNKSLTSWSQGCDFKLYEKGTNKVRLVLRAALNAGIDIGEYDDKSTTPEVLPRLEDGVMKFYHMSDTISNLSMEEFCTQYNNKRAKQPEAEEVSK